jgi:uncharacterized protein
MPNRLIHETSPYLLQHANNPVDWFAWGEEALTKAQKENKPVFLSIGYAACHWCHVMAHESFEDRETAQLLNQSFVSIKVDREERPDLDSIYMTAITAITGSGGWPMSVFLTPDGRPFFGGTYFPPTRRYGMPSFKEVLISVAQTWKEKRAEIDQMAEELTAHLHKAANRGGLSKQPLDNSILKKAASGILNSYDWKDGGWGQAPKFPQPMVIEFLLRQASRGEKIALQTATHALRAMNRGGMKDEIDGGFHRYSTDATWLVPHFEKMLYDNAQLASVYLHGFQLTGDPSFRQTCVETLNFIQRELSHPSGGFYSSLDADSEGKEGKYYLWKYEEIRDNLGNEPDFELFRKAYGLKNEGNFEGNIILQRSIDDAALAQEMGLPVERVLQHIEEIKDKLLFARQARIRPATDDKVLVSWNALALLAFADAGRSLQREDYLETARKNATFLLEHLIQEGRLLRSWRDGRAHHNAFLEDYAVLILALLSLYESDADIHWFATAETLCQEMVEYFSDGENGFYDTHAGDNQLVIRPKDVQDNATPSGNSLAALALLQISAYTDRGDWRDRAEKMLSGILEPAARYPTAFGFWLQAVDFAVGPIRQIALLYPKDNPKTAALVDNLWNAYHPRTVAAIAPYPPPQGSPNLLFDRPLLENEPTVYICKQFVCSRPVNTAADFKRLLAQEA